MTNEKPENSTGANGQRESGILQSASLLSLIRSAQASIPAFRYIVGFAAVAALLLVILRAWDRPAALGIGSVVMILGGILIRIFGRSIEIRGKRVNFAAEILIYYVLAVVVFIVTMLVSSVFFDAPVPLRSKIFGPHSSQQVISGARRNEVPQPSSETTDHGVPDDSVDSTHLGSNSADASSATLSAVASLEEAKAQIDSNSALGAVAELESDLRCALTVSGERIGYLYAGIAQFLVAPPGAYRFECESDGEAVAVNYELRKDKRKIIAFNFVRRFQIARNGAAIVDEQTRNVWQRGDAGRGLSFEDAKAYCAGKNQDATTDWRLPSVEELQSLFLRGGNVSNRCNKDPDADVSAQFCYVDKKFDINSYSYWSGDWEAGDPAPLVVDFLDRGSFGYLGLNEVPSNGVTVLTADGARDAAYGVLCIDR